MKKRITSFILMLTLLLGMIPAVLLSAAAASLPYDATIGDDAIYIGGVRMQDKTYLPVGGNMPVSEKPDGGYAYVEINTSYSSVDVTLFDYVYEGEGITYNATEDMSAVILSTFSGGVDVYVNGECALINTKNNGTALVSANGTLHIGGRGLLTLDADLGIYGPGKVSVFNYGKTYIQNAVTGIQGDKVRANCLKVEASGTAIFAETYVDLYEAELIAGNYGIYHNTPASDEDRVAICGDVKITSVNGAIESPRDVYMEGDSASLEAFVTTQGKAAVNVPLAFENVSDYRVSFGANKDDLDVTDVVYDKTNPDHADSVYANYIRVVPEKAAESSGPVLTVAGVTMTDGDYLKTNVYVPTKEKPADGGYAYYKDGVLTLFNYRHVSGGTPANIIDNGPGYYGTALIHSTGSLTLKLEGESYLESTDKVYGAIVCSETGNLDIIGDGVLEGKSTYGITANGEKLSVTDATLKLHVFENNNYSIRYGGGLYVSGYLDIDHANVDITVENSYVHGMDGYCNILNSTVSITGEGTHISECGISGYCNTVENSDITVKNMEDAIDEIKGIARNSTFTLEDCEYGITVTGVAMNCIFKGSAYEFLYGYGKFVDCDITVEGKALFCGDTFFVGCTIQAICENSAIGDDCYPELLNCETNITCKYLSWYDAHLYVQGGTLTVNASEKIVDDCKFKLYVRKGAHTVSYGASAENLTVNAQSIDDAVVDEAINTVKYLKVVAAENVPLVKVGGIGMKDGDYLPSGATAIATAKPAEGGYAYYKDGVLTLHDFVYAADTTASGWDHFDSVIVSYHPLTLVLEGESRIYRANDGTDDIWALYCFGDLTVTGNTLTTEMLNCGYHVWGDLVIDGTTKQTLNTTHASGSIVRIDNVYGDLTVNSGYYEADCIASEGTLTVNGGEIKTQLLSGNEIVINGGKTSVKYPGGGDLAAVNASNGFTMNGGELTVESDSYGIASDQHITVNGGTLKIHSDDAILLYGGKVAEFLGGTVELISIEDTVFYYGDVKMPYLAKVSNCHLTVKCFMKDPKFDLSDYVIYDATYSMRSDFSDVKTYTGEPIEFCFLFEVTPAGSIAFNAGGGSGEMATVNELSGSVALPKCTFTAPTGKQFKGWSLSENGEILADTVYVDGAITLYAIWEDDPNYNPDTPDGTTPDGTTPDGTTPDGTKPDGTDTPDDPDNGSNGSDENDGLGAGAIIGIVLGSLAVLGGGGFALYWFLLRKKTLTAPVDPASVTETEETTEAEDTTEANDEDKE